jgi:hypothetical protein
MGNGTQIHFLGIYICKTINICGSSCKVVTA